MEKQAGHQLELFSESQDNPQASISRSEKNSFIARIWGYEKTILIIIALLITGIISFSFGVEKGKRMLVNQPIDLAIKGSKVAKDTAVRPEGHEIPVKKVEALRQLPAVLTQQGSYTIQVASFKAKFNAQKEAELLKKKGFTALALNKGNYVILCVGNFPNKETAQPLLLELSKYYRSCYIRRL